jgi:hypothetical protein
MRHEALEHATDNLPTVDEALELHLSALLATAEAAISAPRWLIPNCRGGWREGT